MKERNKLEITLLSGACCNPSLVSIEKDLEKRLGLVVREVGLDARVKLVSLSAVLAGNAEVTKEQAELIQAMFQKFGARMAPAALVEKRVLFAGGSPSSEKLAGMLEMLRPPEPVAAVEKPVEGSGCSCGCCGQ